MRIDPIVNNYKYYILQHSYVLPQYMGPHYLKLNIKVLSLRGSIYDKSGHGDDPLLIENMDIEMIHI